MADPMMKHRVGQFMQMQKKVVMIAEAANQLDLGKVDKLIEDLERAENPELPDPIPGMEKGFKTHLLIQLAKCVRTLKAELPTHAQMKEDERVYKLRESIQ